MHYHRSAGDSRGGRAGVMIDDIETYRSAKTLLDSRGADGARERASENMQVMVERRDWKGPPGG